MLQDHGKSCSSWTPKVLLRGSMMYGVILYSVYQSNLLHECLDIATHNFVNEFWGNMGGLVAGAQFLTLWQLTRCCLHSRIPHKHLRQWIHVHVGTTHYMLDTLPTCTGSPTWIPLWCLIEFLFQAFRSCTRAWFWLSSSLLGVRGCWRVTCGLATICQPFLVAMVLKVPCSWVHHAGTLGINSCILSKSPVYWTTPTSVGWLQKKTHIGMVGVLCGRRPGKRSLYQWRGAQLLFRLDTTSLDESHWLCICVFLMIWCTSPIQDH